MPRLSVIMITGNVIARAPGREVFERSLRSVVFADELVIVDSDSSDGTRDVAARFTDKIFVHPYQNSLKLQKKIALGYATGDWILWVDADEELPPALVAEIRAAIAKPAANGYEIHRQHVFAGKVLHHAGEDCKMRLWPRGVGHWEGPENDEVYVVPAPVGRLTTPLLHFSSATLRMRFEKIAFFTPAHAAVAELPPNPNYSAGDVWRRIIKPSLQQFYGVYWIHRGYRDGVRGFLWACTMVMAEFSKQALIWERAQVELGPPPEVPITPPRTLAAP